LLPPPAKHLPSSEAAGANLSDRAHNSGYSKRPLLLLVVGKALVLGLLLRTLEVLIIG
jgi:hypothetical protein